MTMYPTTKIQVRQFLHDWIRAWTDVRCGVSSVLLWTSSVSRREIASSRSRGVKRLVLAGKSSSMNDEMMAQPQVAEPSTICSVISEETLVTKCESPMTYKEPPPSLETMHTIEASSDCSSDNATKGTRQHRSGNVDGESLRLLISLVPRRKDEQYSRCKACLKSSNDQSQAYELLVVFHDGHAARDSTPERHNHREKD